MISDPIFGPADIVGFSMYDPSESRTWSVLLTPKQEAFPWLPLTPKSTNTNNTTTSASASNTIGNITDDVASENQVSGKEGGETHDANNRDKRTYQEKEKEKEKEIRKTRKETFRSRAKEEPKEIPTTDNFYRSVAERLTWQVLTSRYE